MEQKINVYRQKKSNIYLNNLNIPTLMYYFNVKVNIYVIVVIMQF